MPDANYQAVINAGCLLWMPTINEQEYRDVMTSLLYVQLAANKKHPSFTAPDLWQEVFMGALKQFGWAPLKAGYRSRSADAHFRLAQLIAAEDLPLTRGQQQAGERLCAYVASLPGTDKALQVLQRNIAGYVGMDAVDGGEADDSHAVDLPRHSLPEVVAAEPQAPASGLRAAPRPSPHAVVAVHVGMILPGRRIELLTVQFATRERLATNLFEQQFDGAKLIGTVQIKSFVGELSELHYASFRERLESLVGEHRAREVVERLPFQEYTA
ncbi:hypothetical protein [Pseudomonas sp. MWU16-30317]|uniref:hypothetical protein n=1 Tax=Pseudomonas sp. MWU16-30317 TaxID=2878095 RepID=UPI001CF9B8BD|nr:hypothetical protein [Pseudomonas sp. MWU16-30317]